MTFDKSGQDNSLNVRVVVQVPNRGVTWFHLCIMMTFIVAPNPKFASEIDLKQNIPIPSLVAR